MPIAVTDRIRRGESGAGSFAVAWEDDLKVSHLVVADITARNAIAVWKRIPYMTVAVVATGLEYQLGVDLTIAGQVWTDKTYGLPPDVVLEGDIFDVDGYVQSALIKNVFLNTQYVVASQAAMLALTSYTGNFFIRTDTSEVFIKLNNTNPSLISDFVLASGTSGVLSVNGNTGAVSVTIANLLAVPANQTAFDAGVAANASVLANSGAISTLQSNYTTLSNTVTALDTYAKAHLGVQDLASNIISPTIAQNGHVVKWNNTNNNFELSPDLSGSGFANPMTIAGDIIVATSGGVASRLSIGAATHVLTSDGLTASWSPSTGGGGLTIGSTSITGGTAGRLLTSGATVGEQTLGTNISTFLSGTKPTTIGGYGITDFNSLGDARWLQSSTLGTGVSTWLTTPSWTNFNSAITGTAPFWKTSGTTALIGDVDISRVTLFNSGNEEDLSMLQINQASSLLKHYWRDVNATGLGDREAFIRISKIDSTIWSTEGFYTIKANSTLPSLDLDMAMTITPWIMILGTPNNNGLILNYEGFTGDNRLTAPANGAGFHASNTDIYLGDNSTQKKFGFNATGSYINVVSDATGDTYYRNSGGYFTRRAIGTAGQVMTVSGGLPTWATPGSGGVTNVSSANANATVATQTTTPVITIVNSPAVGGITITGTPSVGQIPIATSGTAATWQTPASGFADPMTTRGDIIIRNASNTTARLGRGTASQVLTSDGTDISWATPSGSGDMILANAQTNTGVKTFNATTLLLRNVANTFNGSFTNTNTADRVYTLKDADGTIAFTSDITGTNSGTNTGDNAVNSLYSSLVSNATHTGDVTGATNLTIANDAVTYAKMQNVSAASRLLGRGDSGSGDTQEIIIGSGLTMTGTTLSSSGGGGWATTGATALTGAVDIQGTTTNTIKYSFPALGTTRTDGAGLWLQNTTAAASGLQQISPMLTLEGRGWKTNATAESQAVKTSTYVLPVQAAANPTLEHIIAGSINGAAYGNIARFIYDGSSAGSRLILGQLDITNNTIAGATIFDCTKRFVFNSNAGPDLVNWMSNFTTGLASITTGGGIARFSGTFTRSSGTNEAQFIKIQPTINTTSTYAGIGIGVDIDPILTSTVGYTNIALRTTSGQILLNGTTVTAATTLDVRGISGGSIHRLASNANTERFDFLNDGSLEIGGSAGTNGQMLTSAGAGSPVTWTTPSGGFINDITGTYGGSSQTTALYQLNEMVDGEAVYVECIVTCVQSSGTPGATAFSFTAKGTFRRSGGVLTQVGSSVLDEALATWNDTGDSFVGTPGLSVSGSAVSISLNLTTAKTFNYKFSTKIIKR